MSQISKKNKIIETYSLLGIDLVSLILAYGLAVFLRFGAIIGIPDAEFHYSISLYFLLFCVLYSVLAEWNRGFFERGYYVEFVAILKYHISMAVVIGFIFFLTKDAERFSRLIFGMCMVANMIFTFGMHIAFKKFMLTHYRKSVNSDKIMIVTEHAHAEKLLKNILRDKAWNYEVTSIALIDKDERDTQICGIPVIAAKEDLFEISRQMTLDSVFLYLPHMEKEELKALILDYEEMGVTCYYNVDMPDIDLSGKSTEIFAGYAVVLFSGRETDYRRLLVKRLMDICGSVLGLFITGILYPFIAIAIKLESRGPVLFSQIRIGKNGRRFRLYKFRSMYIDAETRKSELQEKNEMQGLMFKIEDDPRITKVGNFLRKTSIDEFPQFYNVFLGDMSLVGTRPPTEDEFERYNIRYRKRMSITPGLTGLWQVNGRSDVTDFEDVVKYDIEYIENWSLGLDIKILAQTIFVVLFGKGAK